jgi:hypothetical protein
MAFYLILLYLAPLERYGSLWNRVHLERQR